MFFLSFTKTSACLPYVFHVATRLITFGPVNDLPFLDDVVFVIGCYQEFRHCVGTFEVSLDSLLHMFLKLSLRPLEYRTTMKIVWFLLLFLCDFVLLCYCFDLVGIPVWLEVCGTPNQDNCICGELFGCVGFLVLIIVGWNRHTGPCVRECCKFCICW